MKIKKIGAKIVLNSRKEKTIEVFVLTEKGNFKTSAPSGKSKGKYEAQPYFRSLKEDVDFINNLKADKINKLDLKKFRDLKSLENFIGRNIGANSLFALEASILKSLAFENNKELGEFLGRGNAKNLRSVGNTIGGGMHSRGFQGKKPDFQEFLFIASGKNFSECVKINQIAYKMSGKILNSKKTNDEGAWETSLDNEGVLQVMDEVRNELKKKGMKVDIGLDIAASGFFKNSYSYKNNLKKLTNKEQINYITRLANKFNIFYIEDPLHEEDFEGFSELTKKLGEKSLIVGDDLTVTNLLRLKKAFIKKSINAIIVKPNQNGSLIKVKEIVDFCRKKNIKIIISHRSGETNDSTIADLAVAWKADFIKTGIKGSVRESKLRRIIEINKK